MNKIFRQKLDALKKELTNLAAAEPSVYDCSLCQDRGLIYENGEARVCICVRKKQLENQCKHARLSGEYRHKHFSDFNISYYAPSTLSDQRTSKVTYRQLANHCISAAKAFTHDVLKQKEHKGMYIYGTVGSGKTLLASCIANQLIEANQAVLFLSVPDLLDELKDTFNRPKSNELSLMKKVREIPVLIMDDLGAHQYTDWAAGRIYNIINYRASHGLSTIITSNLSVDELAVALDERTSSRILQLCQIYRLETKEDIRRQVYKENLKRS